MYNDIVNYLEDLVDLLRAAEPGQRDPRPRQIYDAAMKRLAELERQETGGPTVASVRCAVQACESMVDCWAAVGFMRSYRLSERLLVQSIRALRGVPAPKRELRDTAPILPVIPLPA